MSPDQLAAEQAAMRERWSRKNREEHAARIQRDRQQQAEQSKGCTCHLLTDGLCEYCLLKDTL